MTENTRAEFSGVMVIESAIAACDKPKTLYIVGTFCVNTAVILGAFRYFNKGDFKFEANSRWFVNTTISTP